VKQHASERGERDIEQTIGVFNNIYNVMLINIDAFLLLFK
jgi:hypothetical protein